MLELLTPDVLQHIEPRSARGGLAPAGVAPGRVALEPGGWARQFAGQGRVSIAAPKRRR
jgi:hypothetical protein